jgi:hypothetical protein
MEEEANISNVAKNGILDASCLKVFLCFIYELGKTGDWNTGQGRDGCMRSYALNRKGGAHQTSVVQHFIPGLLDKVA